ncbi:MAG: FxsA family protein [Acidimicrobiia bacterium]|nr:FxsA family protein [Acidimicrobiia bacterium]
MLVFCGYMLMLAFIVVPVAELYVLMSVEGRIGLAATLGAILLTAIVGAGLLRRQGMATMSAIRRQTATGQFPGRDLAHGGILLFAGGLLLTPGFITDAVGFALLVPAIREVVRLRLAQYFRERTIIL